MIRPLCVLALAIPVAVAACSAAPAASIVGTASPAPASRSTTGGASPSPVASRFTAPEGIAVAPDGSIVFSDFGGEVIYRLSPDGSLVVIAGTGQSGLRGDGGPATSAAFAEPSGLAVDSQGDIFVADHHNQRIRMIRRDGTIVTIAGTGPTGQGQGAFAGDGGSPLDARFSEPLGVALDDHTNLFVGDSFNTVVRKITGAGAISTVLGGGTRSLGGEPIKGTDANLGVLGYLTFDPDGNLYVAERSGSPGPPGGARILRLASDGLVSVFAGTDHPGFSGDGGPAVAAQLSDPNGLAFDRQGNLDVCDSNNHRIRQISPAGIISTIAGTGVAGEPILGGPATTSPMRSCFGLAIGLDGTLYAADGLSHLVLRIDASGTLTAIR